MAASPFRPPERVRTVQVFERADWVLFVILTALNLAVVTLFLRRWLAYDGASDHPVQFVALTVWIAVAIAMYEARWLALPVMRRPVPMEAPPGLRVGVATTFVPSAEPLEMLSETVAGLVAMDYPHDTRLSRSCVPAWERATSAEPAGGSTRPTPAPSSVGASTATTTPGCTRSGSTPMTSSSASTPITSRTGTSCCGPWVI
jgi:hypothetical protein